MTCQDSLAKIQRVVITAKRDHQSDVTSPSPPPPPSPDNSGLIRVRFNAMKRAFMCVARLLSRLRFDEYLSSHGSPIDSEQCCSGCVEKDSSVFRQLDSATCERGTANSELERVVCSVHFRFVIPLYYHIRNFFHITSPPHFELEVCEAWLLRLVQWLVKHSSVIEAANRARFDSIKCLPTQDKLVERFCTTPKRKRTKKWRKKRREMNATHSSLKLEQMSLNSNLDEEETTADQPVEQQNGDENGEEEPHERGDEQEELHNQEDLLEHFECSVSEWEWKAIAAYNNVVEQISSNCGAAWLQLDYLASVWISQNENDEILSSFGEKEYRAQPGEAARRSLTAYLRDVLQSNLMQAGDGVGTKQREEASQDEENEEGEAPCLLQLDLARLFSLARHCWQHFIASGFIQGFRTNFGDVNQQEEAAEKKDENMGEVWDPARFVQLSLAELGFASFPGACSGLQSLLDWKSVSTSHSFLQPLISRREAQRIVELQNVWAPSSAEPPRDHQNMQEKQQSEEEKKEVENEDSLNKYYAQRYRLFSRYDRGIVLDRESWFSATPEMIGLHQALRLRAMLRNHHGVAESDDAVLRRPVVLDAFAGCGGNSIRLAQLGFRVISVDLDPAKLKLLRHNARLHEDYQVDLENSTCNDNKNEKKKNKQLDIQTLCADFYSLRPHCIINDRRDDDTEQIKRNEKEAENKWGQNGIELPEKIDAVFLSPPWGGPEYLLSEVCSPRAPPIEFDRLVKHAFSLFSWLHHWHDDVAQSATAIGDDATLKSGTLRIAKSLPAARLVACFLPRNVDVAELADWATNRFFSNYDDDNEEEKEEQEEAQQEQGNMDVCDDKFFEIEMNYLQSTVKGITVYLGDAV